MVGSIYLGIYNKLSRQEQEALIKEVERNEEESFMKEEEKDEQSYFMDRNLCPAVL